MSKPITTVVYGVWSWDDVELFATRELAEKAIEPRERAFFARLIDPNDDWPGAPGGVKWRVAEYRKMGWAAYWEEARLKGVSEHEVISE